METIPIGSAGPVGTLVLVGVCVLMVALLAGSEASLLSVNKIRIRNLAEQGVKSAQQVLKLVEKHDKLFATILTTENAFIILASSLGAAYAIELLQPNLGHNAVLVASLVMTVFVVIFGEITPKVFAAQNSEKVALTVSGPLLGLMWLVSPVVRLFTLATNALLWLLGVRGKHKSPFLTEEELRMMIQVSSREGVIQQEESELLHNVFEFGDTVVGEVMVPRTQIEALPEDVTIGEVFAKVSETGHSRYPIYGENLDDILGIVYVKDLVTAIATGKAKAEDKARGFFARPLYVPENKLIGELLPDMQKQRVQMVIVADEYGGTEGLATVEDLLGELVGEMETGPAEEEPVRTVDERTTVVDALIAIDEVNEQVGIDLPEGDYQTLAGFVLQQLGHIPVRGEKFVFDNLELTVTAVEGPRIQEITIVKI